MRLKIERICALLVLVVVIEPRAHSKCGENQPAKYQTVVTFAGDNRMMRDEKWSTSLTFDTAIKASTESFGKYARKDLLLLGGSRFGYFFHPKAWHPSPLPKNTTLLDASRKDWIRAAKLIADDYVALKRADRNLQPDEYQVTIHVTNHGDYVAGKTKETEFGIVTSPLEKEMIDANDIREFARTLPPKIRVKLIFTQCYSSDTSQIFLDSLAERDNRCSCGIASADFGSESYHGPDWDEKIIKGLEDGSMVSVVNTTVPNPWAATNINDPDGSGDRDARTTRANLVYRLFLDHPNVSQTLAGIHSKHGRFGELVMQKYSAAILKDALSNGPLSETDEDALNKETSVAVGLLKKRFPSTDAVDFERLLSIPGIESMSHSDPSLDGNSYVQALRNQLKNSSRHEAVQLHMIRSRWDIIQATAVWLQLYEAFLRFASETDKKAARDLLLCETDPVGFRPVEHLRYEKSTTSILRESLKTSGTIQSNSDLRTPRLEDKSDAKAIKDGATRVEPSEEGKTPLALPVK